MENFVVSARKYRPATFASVVGQEHITTTLKNAIGNNHLAHAFLFCGPRGVGKTTCARILAKTINCLSLTSETEACNTCDNCLAFNNNASFNVHELDAASNNSVEDIRSLVEQVRYAPQTGKYKIYIIDEVHMLSNTAFNAFLKTLEEPPSYAIFILATTEKHKIIPTILSRCQIFDFNRIQLRDIACHLQYIADKEHIDAEPEALNLIAQKADGGLRDALSIFDLISTFSAGRQITYKNTIDNLHILDYDYYFRVTDALLEEDLPSILLIYDEILRKGFDGHNFIAGLCEHFRNLMVCKDASTLSLMEVSGQVQERYKEQARAASVSLLLTVLGIATQADSQFKASKNQRLLIELALMKMCYVGAAIQLGNGNPLAAGGEKKKSERAGNSVIAGTTTQARPPILLSVPVPATNGGVSNSYNGNVSDTTPGPGPFHNAVMEEPAPVLQLGSDAGKTRLENVWAELVNQLKGINDYNNASLLEDKPLKHISENEVIITFASKVQIELFSKLKERVLNWLRAKLQNPNLSISTEIGEIKTDKLIYSPQEKFFHLAERHPILIELKEVFALELER